MRQLPFLGSAHRLEHKSTLYEEACRIPLVIKPAGGTKERIDNTHLVSNGLDLLPTFCDWMGVAPPRGLPGRSLRGLVADPAPRPWRTALPVECVIGRAIVTQRFKYCVYDIGRNRRQLMDLESDPWEQRNALGRDPCRSEVETLSALFRETFGDGLRNAADVLAAAVSA